jgi:hypothetical protein
MQTWVERSSYKLPYRMKLPAAPVVARCQTSAIATAEGARVSSDNPLAAFVTFLAEHTKVGERSARLYVAHLQRFAAWLEQHYQALLLDVTTRDLREYRAELAQRQKPASVNAALAALRRFYGWAADTDQVAKNPAQHLADVESQQLAPKRICSSGSPAVAARSREGWADGRRDHHHADQHRPAGRGTGDHHLGESDNPATLRLARSRWQTGEASSRTTQRRSADSAAGHPRRRCDRRDLPRQAWPVHGTLTTQPES